jgi:hypothetical protein
LDPAKPFIDPARTVTVQHVSMSGQGGLVTNGTMRYTVAGTLHAVGDESGSTTSTVSGSLNSTNFNRDPVTTGSMRITTSASTTATGGGGGGATGGAALNTKRISTHEYPYALIVEEREDNKSGTFFINATVNISRRRGESVLRNPSVGAEWTPVLDVQWANAIQSHGEYNRSVKNHTLIYRQIGHSTESFWVADGDEGRATDRCFDRNMVGDQGFVVSDTHAKGTGNSTAGCKALGSARFCGSELCGL